MSIREELRRLKVFPSDLPAVNFETAPADPVSLFLSWLRHAIDAGVPEPHAMTVSTVTAAGAPNARVLILKDVDAGAFYFASSALSRKGRELAASNAVALCFHWKELGRQVRILGQAMAADRGRSDADFRARPIGSKVEGLIGRQSEPLASRDELMKAVAGARRKLEAEPDLIAPSWTLYAVEPSDVEFWQADHQRQHARLHYWRDGESWQRGLLWP